MCKKAVDVCLLALKYFPDWFVIKYTKPLIMHALTSLASVVTDMKNATLIKRDRQKFNGCSMASIKMMRLVYAWRWKEKMRVKLRKWVM